MVAVLHMMVGRMRKEKGSAEKARMKKKRMLEEASKCSKITDLFQNQPSTSDAGKVTEKQLAIASRHELHKLVKCVWQ